MCRFTRYRRYKRPNVAPIVALIVALICIKPVLSSVSYQQAQDWRGCQLLSGYGPLLNLNTVRIRCFLFRESNNFEK